MTPEPRNQPGPESTLTALAVIAVGGDDWDCDWAGVVLVYMLRWSINAKKGRN